MLASHSPAPRRHRVSNIESIRLQQMLLMLSPSVLALHSCLSLLFFFKKKKSSVATGIGEVEKYSDLNSNAVMLMSAGYISQKKKKKKKHYIIHWCLSLQHCAGANTADPVGNLM